MRSTFKILLQIVPYTVKAYPRPLRTIVNYRKHETTQIISRHQGYTLYVCVTLEGTDLDITMSMDNSRHLSHELF